MVSSPARYAIPSNGAFCSMLPCCRLIAGRGCITTARDEAGNDSRRIARAVQPTSENPESRRRGISINGCPPAAWPALIMDYCTLLESTEFYRYFNAA